MIRLRKSDENRRLEGALSSAIADLRAAELPSETLSASARGRIVDAVFDPSHDPAAPASLFLPARRLALAGVLPALLGAAFLLLLGHAGITRVPGRTRLVVEKHDDAVVFRVANGGKTHVVCKSSLPNRFDCGAAVPLKNGTFADPVRGDSEIVFYRID